MDYKTMLEEFKGEIFTLEFKSKWISAKQLGELGAPLKVRIKDFTVVDSIEIITLEIVNNNNLEVDIPSSLFVNCFNFGLDLLQQAVNETAKVISSKEIINLTTYFKIKRLDSFTQDRHIVVNNLTEMVDRHVVNGEFIDDINTFLFVTDPSVNKTFVLKTPVLNIGKVHVDDNMKITSIELDKSIFERNIYYAELQQNILTYLNYQIVVE